MQDWILYDVEDGVCTITINRPEKKNAMSFGMLADFLTAFKTAGTDDAARVVVLRGTGGAFCNSCAARPRSVASGGRSSSVPSRSSA